MSQEHDEHIAAAHTVGDTRDEYIFVSGTSWTDSGHDSGLDSELD